MRLWFTPSAVALVLAVAASTTATDVPVAAAPKADTPSQDPGDAGAVDSAPELTPACAALLSAVKPAIDTSRIKAKSTDFAVGLITRDRTTGRR